MIHEDINFFLFKQVLRTCDNDNVFSLFIQKLSQTKIGYASIAAYPIFKRVGQFARIPSIYYNISLFCCVLLTTLRRKSCALFNFCFYNYDLSNKQ